MKLPGCLLSPSALTLSVILMYLQLLIIALLMIALMSPFIQLNGSKGGRSVLLLDTSASMQHKGSSGKTRLEEAIEQACDYVQTMEHTQFSVITTDASGAELFGSGLGGICTAD